MAPLGTLYTSKNNPLCLKIFAVAAINDLEINTFADFQYGVTEKSPEYLAKFPMGKVPALETSDGFCLAESQAISFFIAESGPKKNELLGTEIKERALIQQWIFLAESNLNTILYALNQPIMGRVEYDKEKEAENDRKLAKILVRIENHLKDGKKWLVNDSYPSLADITLATSFAIAFKFLIGAEQRGSYPLLVAWFKRFTSEEKVKAIFETYVEFVEVRKQPKPVTASG